MNAPFLRLFWKEYRAQRSLWLVLTSCLVLLQTVIVVVNDQSHLAEPVLVFAVVVTCCFLVASVALLFAGEEDLGTATWLRQIPVSTSCLFWSKVSAALAGTLAMMAIAVCSTLIILAARHWTLEWSPEGAAPMAFFAGTLFLVSLFWSLRCRSVFRSLGLSSATIVAAVIIFRGFPKNQVECALALACSVLIAVLPLPRRWHRGLPVHGARRTRTILTLLLSRTRGRARRFLIVPGIMAIAAGWLAMVGIFAEAYPAWAIVMVFLPVLAIGLRASLFLLGRQPSRATWLQAAAAAPTQLKRTCAVLLWRECRFAVPFGLLSIAAGIVAVVARVNFTPDTPWSLILLFVLVVECGLRTFRHDQQHLHGLFWSHRGISPLLVWGIRSAVWFGVLAVVSLTLLFIDLPDDGHSGQSFHGRIIDVVTHAIRIPGHEQASLVTTEDRWLQYAISLAWLTGGFFIAQLCSGWIRKPLIAMFVAMVAVVSYTTYLVNCVTTDIPLVLSAWPVTALAAMALVGTRRQWMDRRFSLWIGLQRTALILLPLLCLWPVRAAWRVLQVPAAHVSVSTPEQQGYTAQNQSGHWADQWKALDTAVQPLLAKNARVATTRLDEVRLQGAMAAIDRILREALEFRELPPQWRIPWCRYPAQPIAFALVQKAEELKQHGDHAQALQRLVDAVRITRFLEHEATSWHQWSECLQLEQYVLQNIHWIAAEDHLSAQQLRFALAAIQGVVRRPLSAAALLEENRICVYTQLLNRSGYLWEHYQQLQQESELQPRTMGWPVRLIEASESERERFRRLLLWSHPSLSGASRRMTGFDLDRCVATTITEGTDLAEGPVLIDGQTDINDPYEKEFRRTLNAERATQLVLELQAYRRQHGEFPMTLAQLQDGKSAPVRTPDADSRTLQNIGSGGARGQVCDLESGVPFQYSRDGLRGSDLHNRDPNRMPVHADQPLLWSRGAGPHGDDEERDQRPLWRGENPLLELDPSRVVYLDGGQTPIPGR